MQKQITTHKGDTLLLIEVPLDATFVSKYNLQISYRIPSEGYVYVKDIPISSKNCELVGTTSTLTDEDVYLFVEGDYRNMSRNSDPFDMGGFKSVYKDKLGMFTLYSALEAWDDFLQANNIDTTKNYCILKILNNE